MLDDLDKAIIKELRASPKTIQELVELVLKPPANGNRQRYWGKIKYKIRCLIEIDYVRKIKNSEKYQLINFQSGTASLKLERDDGHIIDEIYMGDTIIVSHEHGNSVIFLDETEIPDK